MVTVPSALADGDTILRLGMTRWTWIQRRTDRLGFIDEMTIHQTMRIEVAMKADLHQKVPDFGGCLLLPLAILRLTAGVDVVARGAAGELLQVLPRDVERTLVAQGIVSSLLAAAEVEAPDEQEVEALVDDVRCRIAGMGVAEGPSGSLVPDHLVDQLIATVNWWSLHFMVVVRVPDAAIERLDGFVSTVVLEQLLPLQAVGFRASEQEFRSGDSGLPRSAARWATDADDLQSAASYHFDVEAPPGVCIVSSALRFAVVEDQHPSGPIRRIVEVLEHDQDPKRVALSWNHLQARRDAPQDDLKVDGAGVVDVVLAHLPQGTLVAGRVAAWASTITLITLVGVAMWSGGDAKFGAKWSIDPNSVVSMLLIGPTLLIGYALQREEHLMTRRITASFRMDLLKCALSTFTAALVVALGIESAWLGALLMLPAMVCAAYAIRIERTFRSSRAVVEGQRQRGCALQCPSTCTNGPQPW